MARALGRARIARLFGHRFASRLHRLATRLRWRETRVRLMADSYDEIAGIASVRLSPAKGMFDLAVLDGLNHADTARSLIDHGIVKGQRRTRPPMSKASPRRPAAAPTDASRAPLVAT